MPRRRTALDVAQIGRCFDAYLDVIRLIDGLRIENEMARLIQYPKLPALCTQDMVRQLVLSGILLPELSPVGDALIGTTAADVHVMTGGRWVTVEVKSTARDYTELSKADVLADYFVWLDFRPFRADRTVTIYTVIGPVQRFGWLQDGALHMATFLRATEGQRRKIQFSVTNWAVHV